MGKGVNHGLSAVQCASFAVGHVLNDLTAQAWNSYILVFLTKVEVLPSAWVSAVLFVPFALDACLVPAISVLCDRTLCAYGRRKIWHLVGASFLSLAFPFFFNRCVGCEGSSASLKGAYYVCLGSVSAVSWGTGQVSHLALLTELSPRQSDRIQLISFRWVRENLINQI